MGNPLSPLLGRSPIPSMESPITLNSLPLISFPMGIFIGLSVATAIAPLLNPSEESIAIVRTIFSPICA